MRFLITEKIRPALPALSALGPEAQGWAINTNMVLPYTIQQLSVDTSSVVYSPSKPFTWFLLWCYHIRF